MTLKGRKALQLEIQRMGRALEQAKIKIKRTEKDELELQQKLLYWITKTGWELIKIGIIKIFKHEKEGNDTD